MVVKPQGTCDMSRSGHRTAFALRRRTYEILERGSVGDHASRTFDRAVILLIIVNLTAVVLESMPQFAIPYRTWFDAIEYVSLVAFTLEYGLRLWTSVEHTPYRRLSAFTARMKYVASAAGIVDRRRPAVLVRIFAAGDAGVVLVLRIVRFLKIARYSAAMRSLLDVLYSERRALFGCGGIFLGVP